MKNNRIFPFFLLKMIVAIFIILGAVMLIMSLGQMLRRNTKIPGDTIDIIVALANVAAALTCYIFIFKLLEKREIHELRLSSFPKYAAIGFITGLGLQLLFVVVIYFAATYTIEKVHPNSFLIPSFAQALTAGFIAEILIVGIFFRLTEEKLGTVLTIIITALLFVAMHVNAPNANLLSVLATAIQSGVLLTSAFVFSRSLWLPIFLHFGWDIAQPGIFGGINPGMSPGKTLFTSTISGPELLTGGLNGPQNSIQSILLCSAMVFVFLWLAKQKNNFIKPYWKNKL